MWGHSGASPSTSAYAVEIPSLDLRGVYAVPAAGDGLGTWHWHVGDAAEPTAVTPLTLRSLTSLDRAEAGAIRQQRPPLAAADHTHPVVEAALAGHAWSAGLRWRSDGDDLYAFTAAGPHGTDGVFTTGLLPSGGLLPHVLAHVADGGAADSLWVTASRDIGRLRAGEGATGSDLLERYGWRYDIAAPGGVDVNDTLDLAAPHPEWGEVLFPGGVDGRYVRGAQRLERGRPVGPYLTNPGFADARTGTATKGAAG
jgi:hypothetical protein